MIVSFFCPLSFDASENDLSSLIVHDEAGTLDDGGAWIFKLPVDFSLSSASICFFFFDCVGRRMDDAFCRFLPSFVVGAMSSDLSGRRVDDHKPVQQ